MNMKISLKIILVTVFLLVLSLPYLAAAQAGGKEYSFNGFLVNPQDGNSYLAKMQEGWSGSWQFTLPYTANPGEGTDLFLFYLLLGHIAHWLGIQLIWMYHIARVICASILAFTIIEFFDRLDSSNGIWGSALALFGSGLGWIVFSSGFLSSDYWVAEAYPFLSAYTNPHFTLSLALVLLALILNESKKQQSLIGLFVIGLLLSIIQPFAVVVLLVVLIGRALLSLPKIVWDDLAKITATGIGGGPWLIYQYLVILNHPVLKIWNSQNITTSPSPLDILISFSPALLFAFLGAWVIWRKRDQPYRNLLLAWLFLGLILIYVPFGLQRRFMLGLFIPVAALALIGIKWLVQKNPRKLGLIFPIIFILSLLTNLTILMAGVWGGQNHNPAIFSNADEQAVLGWIAQSTPQNSVLLASPEISLLIPAQTGRRVVYGHPFETANASVEKEGVEYFYKGKLSNEMGLAYLSSHGINYVIFGNREKTMGYPPILSNLKLVFQNQTEKVYSVPGQP
jgi:hypothetical protein